MMGADCFARGRTIDATRHSLVDAGSDGAARTGCRQPLTVKMASWGKLTLGATTTSIYLAHHDLEGGERIKSMDALSMSPDNLLHEDNIQSDILELIALENLLRCCGC